MKTFKKVMTKNMIASITMIALMSGLFGFYGDSQVAYADEISDLKNQIAQKEAQIKEYDKKIAEYANDATKAKELRDSIQNKYLESENQLVLLGDQIAKQNSAIANKNKEIEAKQAAITAKQAEIDIKIAEIQKNEEDIDNSITLFEEKIRALYISGNDDIMTVLLGSGDFFSMMVNYKFIENITSDNLDFMNELKAEVEDLNKQRQSLEEEKTKLEAEKNALKAQKDQLDIDLADLVKTQKSQSSLSDQLSKDYDKYQSELNDADYLKKLASQKKKATAAQIEQMEAAINKIIEEATRKDTVFEGNSEWYWPLPDYTTLTSPFGDRNFAPNPNHKGIDVSGSGIRGALIKAANDGEVIVVNQSGYGGGYGTYVVVDHGGGYTTFYAHMIANSATVSVGQKVKRGDTLGKVGSTGLSTGPHLHFEIRVNNKPVQPLDYYKGGNFKYAY